MHFFYPLPVTRNYVRLKGKDKKTPKNQGKKEPEKKVSTEHAPVGKILKRKQSIWTQSDSFLEFSTDSYDPIHNQKESFFSNSQLQEVSLFDNADSRNQSSHLYRFFDLYLTRFPNEKKTWPLMLVNEIYDYDFNDIILLYKKFCVFCRSSDKNDTFRSNLFKSLYFPTLAKQKVLFSHKCKGKKLFSMEKKDYEYDPLEGSRWLGAMSWWKVINHNLQDSCSELYDLLKIHQDESSIAVIEKITKAKEGLDDVLRNSELLFSSAEYAAIDRYIYLPRNIPDVNLWSIRQTSIHINHRSFSTTVSKDYIWMTFMRKCGYLSLTAIFNAMQLLRANISLDILIENLESALRQSVEDFFYEVIRPLNNEARYDDHVPAIIRMMIRKFQPIILEIKQVHNNEKKNFKYALTLITRMLREGLAITCKNCEGILEAADINCSTEFLEHLALDMVIIGIILAEKALQKDLLSEGFLLKLSKQKFEFFDTNIFYISCVQLAYCLVAAYRTMNGSNEKCFYLPDSYIRHDFVAFLDQVQRTRGFVASDIEELSIGFTLRLAIFRDRLTNQLKIDLQSITSLAKIANILLCKAKDIE